MAETQDSNHAVMPVSEDDITAALLDITGDLDKAQVLQRKLPAWWKDADTTTRQALQDAHQLSQRPREQATRLLGRVKSLKHFCAEKLKAFLTDKGYASLHVEHDVLEVHHRIVRIDVPTGPVRSKISIDKHSLLQAAMQNFSLASAQPGGMPEGSVIRTAGNRVSGLSAETFVGYCRELDLGAAYQQHLREVFNLPSPSDGPYNPAVADVGKSRCLEHSAKHPSADPLEVSLAFRKGLADTFELPGQPRHMRFEQLAEVTVQDLKAAADHVRTTELSSALLSYLIELPFWSRYLKKTFSGQFEGVMQPFYERMQAVFDQGQTLTDADYREQMNVISLERTQAENAEIKRRTEEALKPGALTVCEVPLL